MQALAHPTRLLILDRLTRSSCPVAELVRVADTDQPAVSHQLRLLRESGFVTGERRGRTVVYSLVDDALVGLIDEAVAHAGPRLPDPPDEPTVA